jgi:phenylalanine-4-hydroxylase
MKGMPVLLTLKNCTVQNGTEVLFDPSWGTFDLAVGTTVTSVFGGPADRENYGPLEDFVAKKIPVKKYSAAQKSNFKLYSKVRALRDRNMTKLKKLRSAQSLWNELTKQKTSIPWLLGLEIYEILLQQGASSEVLHAARQALNTYAQTEQSKRSLEEGLALAHIKRV